MCISDHSDGGKKGCEHGCWWADESFCSTTDEGVPWNGSLLWGGGYLFFQGRRRTDKRCVIRLSHTFCGGRIYDTGFKTAACGAWLTGATGKRQYWPVESFWRCACSISSESAEKWLYLCRCGKRTAGADDRWQGRWVDKELLWSIYCLCGIWKFDGKTQRGADGQAVSGNWDAACIYLIWYGTGRGAHWGWGAEKIWRTIGRTDRTAGIRDLRDGRGEF